MASGHVNRIKRPDTWLHRPMLQNVKKALANPEPQTGHSRCLLEFLGGAIPIAGAQFRATADPSGLERGQEHPALRPAQRAVRQSTS